MKQSAPSAITRARLKKCRAEMARRKVGAYLITNRVDHYHLIGFTGEDSAVLLTRSAVHIISDGRFSTSIAQEAPWAELSLRKGKLNDEIVSVIGKLRLKNVALQAEYMPAAMRAELASRLRGVRIAHAPDIIGSMRLLKDADELRTIKRAIRIAEEAYRATLASLRLGQTELEIAARLEFEMKTRGSSSVAFDTIAAIDANAALPHAFAGGRRLKAGCTLLLDWGATYRFYRSDLTRTVFIGSIPPRMRRAYEVVLEAQRRAIAAIRPKARMCDVDAVARQYIAEAGFAKEFNHGLGHGLGLNTHEAPSLSWRSSAELQPGMVVTVEPGVYLPGVGGVRIEDDVLVTPRGSRVLSRLGKELESAVLAVKR